MQLGTYPGKAMTEH